MSQGVIGFYKDPTQILEAVKKVREKGYNNIDTFSPFPIHGMDGAMGLGRSWMPWITLVMGVTGALSAFLFQSWSSGAFDHILPNVFPLNRGWALNIGGKPFWSIPAFIPITFEWTVLFGGHCTALGMLVVNGLPNLKSPILNDKYAPRVTNDEFALVIFSKDPKFQEQDCLKLLNSLGAQDVQPIKEDD